MMGPFRRLAHLIDQGRQLDAALAGDPFALPAPEDRYSVRQLHGLYPRRHPGLYAPLLGSLALLLGAAPLGLAALRLALPEAPLRPLGWLSALLSRGASLGPRLARDASLLLVATGLLLRLASGETSGLVALGGGACAWLLFNSRAMQRYMELVYAQRLYRAQSANRPGSAQRRLANQAAYRERKRRERSGRS
ncbi:hypothetical protein ISG84_02405 [Pseudomonas aeruginosa]|uniref:hypothetical protein n=1 Tax=Pseudomonas aeruginosa TaxID=287 RepID=UPI001C9DDFFF|nr:hypothetical protein [Pseudomonas aeruginosa]MBY9156270.1 hypothetical protein [Pseudomonas aeruginosa]MBY9357643.1 hypothetical protein [Pseudomonas aeruginosa]MBY9467143.1 hypothetical protein [Pseudomonas aeruginosa]MBY9542582.1 hypothetical protein [Pseudomonas aeruginosa]MBY9554287.1 hypothetical protein [Pseudomonas aeruginosa]